MSWLKKTRRDCKAGFVGVDPGAQKVMKIVLRCGSVGCCVPSYLLRCSEGGRVHFPPG